MFLLLAIAGFGAWCAHQHWMRLDKDESFWRRDFWPWAIRGMAFPCLIWALANFGFGDRFPPIVPNVAEAQAARQPWVGRWAAVNVAGTILVLSYWVAITYVWILAKMFAQSQRRSELAFNVAVLGLFSGAFGGALWFANGLLYAGAAITVVILPIVYFAMDLAEAPAPRPVYDRAMGQINFGKYQAAEWELISQLEKKEEDFQGWMMLAELYARQHKNIEDAARVILDLVQHPKTQPSEISIACHKLADWQMEIAGNPEGARAALELLCRKLPDTHFYRMAQQRIKQLPRDAAEFEEMKKPKRISLPALREEAEAAPNKPATKSAAAVEANRLSDRLTEDPNDLVAREKLARVLAVDLKKVDLGIDQLRLLIDFPESSDSQRAKWLALIASWELNLRQNEIRYVELLRDLIDRYPQSAEAFAAQRQLFLRGQDGPVPTRA